MSERKFRVVESFYTIKGGIYVDKGAILVGGRVDEGMMHFQNFIHLPESVAYQFLVEVIDEAKLLYQIFYDSRGNCNYCGGNKPAHTPNCKVATFERIKNAESR